MTKKPATAVTARATTDMTGLLMLLALSPPCLLLELELESEPFLLELSLLLRLSLLPPALFEPPAFSACFFLCSALFESEAMPLAGDLPGLQFDEAGRDWSPDGLFRTFLTFVYV